MSGLLPCPFCGGEADTQERYDDIWTAFCQSCGAETGFPATCNEFAEADAIEAWNARADTEYGAVPATDENMAKHGWVRERTCHMERSFTEPSTLDHMQEYMCSECGEYAYDQTRSDDVLPNYCPNCGAKVVGR